MSVAFPSVPEQHAIASYLDDHCGRIDHAISIVDKQIDAYKRLKKSLINEVVTGKRKV
jgi:restriction endonuclease S subunit